MDKMKNRWIALYVENQVGVLAKVSGLFSAKSYNLRTLTVGITEREDVSRMTISVMADDVTFEQIKKQLNAMVEVIKVIDLTTIPIHMKEILYATVHGLDTEGKTEAFQIAEVFDRGGSVKICDIGSDTVLFECTLTENKNNEIISLLKARFKNVQIVRGGAVAVEAISRSNR